MISKYFRDFDKKIIKKQKGSAKTPQKKGKGSPKVSVDKRMLMDSISRIIPTHLTIGTVRCIDTAGFSPDGIDFLAYEKYCQDIIDLMGGYVPYELAYGMFHVIQNLNKDLLTELLNRIATAKKLNMYAPAPEEEGERSLIPSFAITGSTQYQFIELKNDIMNYYLSKNIEYQYEIDVLMVMHKGIIVKNWREKRSFIALETNEDTFMWFFILMNEYLDIKKDRSLDFRKYVKKEVIYNEF